VDENTWRLAQLMMWLIGGQTAILGFIFLFIWNHFSKIEKLLQEQGNKISEVDKRLYGIETVLHMKDCCMLKQDQSLRKVE